MWSTQWSFYVLFLQCILQMFVKWIFFKRKKSVYVNSLLFFPSFFFFFLQAAVMDLVESDKQRGLVIPVWKTYEVLLQKSCPGVQLPNQLNKECCRRFVLSVLIQYVLFLLFRPLSSWRKGLPSTIEPRRPLLSWQQGLYYFITFSSQVMIYHVHNCNYSLWSFQSLSYFFLFCFVLSYKCLQFPSVVPTKRDVSVWEPDPEEGGHSCWASSVTERLCGTFKKWTVLRNYCWFCTMQVLHEQCLLCTRAHLVWWTWNCFVFK